MSASDSTDNRMNLGAITSILVALLMISAGFITLLQFGVDAGTVETYPAEHFVGYDLESDTWVNSDLGKAYMEGDFVSYQLRIDNTSAIWGSGEFNIKYNFYQGATGAVFVDGFDTSMATGFQFSTGDLLTDGVQVPSSGWGTHIPTPEAGETAAANEPQIVNYMDVWEVGDPDSEADPSDDRYFTIKNIPWDDLTDGHVIIFFRAHLALSIVWRADFESALPKALDGDEFEDWTGTSPHNGSSYASGSSRHFTIEHPGVGAKTIPIPITNYPTNMITGRKLINNVPHDGWFMHMSGQLSLWGSTGEDYVYISYNPPAVQTGDGPWALGYFAFDGLPRGNYTVWENQEEGCILDIVGTSPFLHLYEPDKLPYYDAVSETWMDNPDAEEKVRFDLDRGTKVSPKVQNIDFYNLQVGNVSGYKIHDMDGDGAIDAGEPGLGGWTIELWDSDGLSLLEITTTDDDGYFEFREVVVGDHTLKEVMQDGWYNTTSDEVNVRIDVGSEIDTIRFLNANYSSICGYKVQDMDGNGSWDPNDPVIYNWEIELYKDGTFVGNTFTDEGGRFCFNGLAPGHYTVQEVLPDNWYYTNEISFSFDIESGDHEEVVFLNTEMVSICGYKYEDMMGDGVYDEGVDPGVEGWAVYLYQGSVEPGEHAIRSNVTDENGYFCFNGLASGTYTVVEESREGWYNTTLGEIEVTLLSGGSEEIMFLNTEYAEICGYKYEDMDGDGQLDDGDPAVEGWEVELWCGDLYMETVLTDESGIFCFDMVAPGSYTVKEVMQDDWYATSPESVNISKTSGGDDITVTFLNTRYGDICVFKYEDLNGNGEWDEGEPGMSGVTVELFEPVMEFALMSEPGPIMTGVTNGTGMVCFCGLPLGSYLVVEHPPLGTYPNAEGTSKLVDITTSNQSVQVTFGNIENGQICVLKYEDIDGDGTLDLEDVQIGGVLITLYDSQMVEIANGTTGECPCGCGGICFSGLAMGTYFVRETVPEGWFNTTPAEVQVTLDESGETEYVTFLNSEYSSISGNKYEDMDGDGYLDLDDMPVENWEVQLWLDDEYIATNLTDENGRFSFDGLVPGNYYVIETMQEGWYPTTTTEVYVHIDSGVHVGDVLFLNTVYSSVCILKCEDLNGDGEWQEGEPGIPDWEINLYRMSQEMPALNMVGAWVLVYSNLTDEDGRHCFTNLAPGQYMVEEVMREGWYNTTNSSYEFEITSGDRESFIFLNTENGRICGYKVEDLNGNGIWDDGEAGVEGWYIELWKDGSFLKETYTDERGQFCFGELVPGLYTVYEGTNENWYSTNVTEIEVPITSGAVREDIVFLNTRYGEICVYKYEDENGNGIRDEGEDTLVDGVLIELLLDGDVVRSGHTGQNQCGVMCFTGLVLGNYTVRETLNEGWYNEAPLEQWADIDVSGESIEISFVNIRLGQICALKFHDLDGDGVRDENEPVMAGVVIELRQPNGTLIANGTTDESGRVCFTGLVLGDYLVMEIVPPGWYATNGTSFPVSIVTSGQYVEAEFLNTEFGQICVYKYEDLNGDGVLDDGEPAVPGVFVELLLDDEVMANGTTDENGTICFTGLVLGDYLVRETVPEGWYATSSTEVRVTVDRSGECEQATFLNTRYGTICVYKYEDLNGDGGWQENEPVVGGVTITLMSGDEIAGSGATDENGTICFHDLFLGDYVVMEDVPLGWYNTTEASVGVTLDASGERGTATFLNTRYGTICVYKYEDLNGDGEWQENEPAVANVTITLTQGDAMIGCGVTDENGTICFTGLVLGDYVVSETVPEGWYATSLVSVELAIEVSGQGVTATFLNAKLGTICVLKYEDENGNGIRDEGEDTLVDGVTIVLRDATGAIVGTGVTGDDGPGMVCFTGLRIGTYHAEESDWPEGWYPSGQTTKEVRLESSGGRNCTFFLNIMFGKICVYKYEDLNGNGVLDDGEPPVANVTITLTQGDAIVGCGVTDENGTICFNGLVLGEYTVIETVPEGWYATTPASVGVEIDSSGERGTVTFLNTRYGTICAYKYEDLNGDGVLDDGEPAVPGVFVELLLDDEVMANGTTDENGTICFTGLVLGEYTVIETVPEGWYATTPASVGVEIDSSGERGTVTFLNTRYGTICVYKYEDENGNGTHESEEAAVEGVHIVIRGATGAIVAQGFTDENGEFCYCPLVIGTYFVEELISEGWYAHGDVIQQATIDTSGQSVHVTFLNIRYGEICVWKYEDKDGSGSLAPGEPGVGGVVINLYNETMSLIGTNTTDDNGYACFYRLKLGTYYVEEVLPDGWYTEGDLVKQVVIDESGETEFPLFANIRYGQICAFKYEDLNGNGVLDDGEPAVHNVTMNLLLDGDIVCTNVTDRDGKACFHGLTLGDYQVQEVLPDGWYTDGQLIQDAAIDESGKEVSVTFLNIRYGKICVLKYEDVNGNGELDDGDTVVPGVLITLYDPQMVEIANGTTGECGGICFSGLEIGQYFVGETLADEWYTEGPTLKQVSVNESGEEVYEHFLNIRYGKICVFKYEDLNGDGVWQENEPGLPGVVIELVQDCEVVRSDMTNDTGWICFELLRFGEYCVRENLALSDMDCCWYPSTHDRVNVTLSVENQQDLVIFGNVKYGKICGWKYFDENQNGLFDECTEHGLAGWTMQLWKNGTLFGTMTTDGRGHFVFAGLEFGDYVVTEVMQDGWYATGALSWNVTLDRSGDREDVFFLNALCGDICVYKYEDLNGNGVLDDGEPAVSGVTVHLYRDNVLLESNVTDENGRYCFEDLMVGTYLVAEEVPCDWYSTTGITQQVVMTGQDVAITFLNTRYGCIGGFKYNDANGNGAWDICTENGISGWEIELYQDGRMIAWTQTDADGHYAFCGLRLGNYTVREMPREGWMATAPAEINVTVGMSGQLVCGVNFLNMELNPCIEVEKGVSSETITYESHTQGYWKNHLCAWEGIGPQDMFPWVCHCTYPCGLTYLQVFNTPPAGDATLILAHQYIAAKLNMLKFGAPPMYADLIAQAEEFLADHPLGCYLGCDDRNEATELSELLTSYNEGDEECGLTVLTYTVTVTNCGNVELYNVKVYDSLLDQWFYLCDFGDQDGILGVGEWWTFSYNFVVPADHCDEEPTGDCGCGGWTWTWHHGCGGGCHYGDDDHDGWSWSWCCGDHHGRTDSGCGGWNWHHGYGTGCGGWKWSWCWGWQHHCGGGCGEEPLEPCTVTNIATGYGQWGLVADDLWVSDSDQADFVIQQESPTGDDGCCHHWNWCWLGCWGHQWSWGGWGHDWHGDWGCHEWAGWSWSGCGCHDLCWDLDLGGCRWWGLFSDGMIGACHVWNVWGPGDDPRNKEDIEAVKGDQ